MPYPCLACGQYVDLTEHHIINKAYGGYNQPTVTLCRKCHDQVHGLLTTASRNIGKIEPFQEVMVGGLTCSMTAGSVVGDSEWRSVVGERPVLGVSYANVDNSSGRFEAMLSQGKVVTFKPIDGQEGSWVGHVTLYYPESALEEIERERRLKSFTPGQLLNFFDNW